MRLQRVFTRKYKLFSDMHREDRYRKGNPGSVKFLSEKGENGRKTYILTPSPRKNMLVLQQMLNSVYSCFPMCLSGIFSVFGPCPILKITPFF